MRIDQRLGAGTTGGTLLSIIGQLGLLDVVKTAVLAAIGAVVSFAVSWALQRWGRQR
jgi:hypothetical protein